MTTPGVPDEVRVVVFGKPGCHLCDVAYDVVDQVCAVAGATWRAVQIQDDPDLMTRYGEQIPVTFVDGQEHAIWRVEPDQLRAALS
jgi:Glutaredoxin-like domain (DUF836)